MNRLVRYGGLIALAWCGSAAARQAPIGQLAPEERSVLARVVGDAEIVTFGESAHRLRGAHTFAVELFEYLVEEKGFRVLFLESSWWADARLMPYVNGETDALPPDAGFYLNAFDSPQTRQLLDYMRAHNRTHPDDPLIVAGMHPENPVSDAEYLWAYLNRDEVDASAAVRDAAAAIHERFGAYESDVAFLGALFGGAAPAAALLTEEGRAPSLAGLTTIAGFLRAQRRRLDTRASRERYTTAYLSALSLTTYLDAILPFGVALRDYMQRSPEEQARLAPGLVELRRSAYGDGDAARAAIVTALRDARFGGRKAMTWLHDWHAADRSDEMGSDHVAVPPAGTKSFGTILEEAFGNEHVIIGSITAPATPRPDSLATLGERFEALFGARRTIIDMTKPSEFATVDAVIHTPGVMVADPTLEIRIDGVVLADHFDAVVYLPDPSSLNGS